MKPISVGFFLFSAFFIALFLTLSDYGVHEDNLFHFMRGQYFLQKFSGKTQFENTPVQSPVFFVPGQRISLYKPNPPEELYAPIRSFGKQVKELKIGANNSSFYKHNLWGESVWNEGPDQGHPAVSDTLMALTNRVFYEKLGFVGDVEGYYVYIVFVSALALFFVYLFTKEVFGKTAAILASITLALFPYYFSESHFNTKDTIQMSFFTGSLVSLYFFVTKKGSGKWFASFIFSSFLALGTKWNIGFLPFIFLPWLWLVRKKEEVRSVLRFPKIFLYAILGVTIPFLLLILAWPYLWVDTWQRLIDTFNFYLHLSSLDPRIDSSPPFTLPFGFNLTPLLRVVTMTPPLTLALFLIGIFLIIFRKITHSSLRSSGQASPMHEEWLILLWLCVPILRVSRQFVDTAGSIRHFIEFLPAFAIIAGIGGSFLISKIKLRIKTQAVQPLFIILYSLFLLLTIFQYHPNENLYFNFLAGGFSGAWSSGLYSWKASYDNVYRQGAVWLNAHVEKDAKLAYLEGTMLAISPVWLRDDIYFGSYFSGFAQKGEYVISLIYPNPPSIFAYLYLDRFLEPVYEVKVDGVSVLKIWQNSPMHLRKEYSMQKQISGTFPAQKIPVKSGRAWQVDMSQTERITKLIFSVPQSCSGKTGGVWIFLRDGKEHFIVPQEQKRGEEIEIDFPAESANAIRFWDIEGNSCLYDAKLGAIYTLN